MLIRITKLERCANKAQSGQTHEGLWLEGFKQFDDKPEEKYEKFIYDWKDGEYIEILEQIGVGAYALINMKRNGRFWDIAGVEEWRSQVPSNSPTERYDNSKQKPAPKVSDSPTSQPVISSEISAKTAALTFGMAFVEMMINAPDRFKKLLKVAITPELLEELVYTYADKFDSWLDHGTDELPDDECKESASDKNYEIPEDDIPF